MISLTALECDIVIVACAISAGRHAALVRNHFAEGSGAGSGFLLAAAVLTGLAVVLTRRPPTSAALAATAAVLAVLLARYALAITAGLPPSYRERESIDTLALATKAIESLGLVAAVHLIGRGRPAVAPGVLQTKGIRA